MQFRIRTARVLRPALDRLSLGLALALFTVAAVALEFRYSYLERGIGRYLAWHNSSRREFGQIWETVALSEDVQQRLDVMANNRRQESMVEERVGELARLVELVRQREKMVLSRERFLEIYDELPAWQSALIVEPVELIELIGGMPDWQRTLLVLEEGALGCYLIDGRSEVLRQLILGREDVEFFQDEIKTRNQSLDAFDWARDQLFRPEVFYDAWALLSPEERAGIPLGSHDLIAWRYRLQRVAVNRGQLVGDRMELGFELAGDSGLGTVRLLGRAPAVLALVEQMSLLAGIPAETGEPAPGDFPGPAPAADGGLPDGIYP